MLTKLIARIVDLSARHAWPVVAAFALLVAAACVYVAGHFAITTDVGRLMDPNAPWARRDAAVAAAFPERGDTTLVVVRAPAPELAAQAARELAASLHRQPARFHSVSLGEGDDFFRRNGLLYLAPSQLAQVSGGLRAAHPMVNALARDPSLRGLSNLLSVTLGMPLQTGQVELPAMAPLLNRTADALEGVLAGRPAALSWQGLMDEGPARPAFSLVEVRPVLDFDQLMPGAPAADAIRASARELRLAQRYQASIALTGPIPLSDDEFASLQEGSAFSSVFALVLVLALLWYALRSGKLVLAVCLTMAGGLALTAALGLMMVGALNLISVAFAILFVGIGVDFGIQFGVRFREMHHREASAAQALHAAGRAIALPLTLAAIATAFGFLAFLPTAYRGVAELGQIAGCGILFVALPSCLTVLPALIRLLDPAPSKHAPGFPRLAPLDRTLQAHRKPLLVGTLALVLAGLPLLRHLDFDFNPLHLKDPRSESMDTLQLLSGSADIGLDNIQVLAPSPAAARDQAARIERLPEVARVLTLASLVPDGQPAKLEQIAAAAARLDPLLAQQPMAPAADGVRFLAGDATAFAEATGPEEQPELVIVNPPRRGLGERLCTWLEASDVGAILYSSCNAVSLAEDLRRLPGWRPVRARVMDMFPQTEHFEVITLLKRA